MLSKATICLALAGAASAFSPATPALSGLTHRTSVSLRPCSPKCGREATEQRSGDPDIKKVRPGFWRVHHCGRSGAGCFAWENAASRCTWLEIFTEHVPAAVHLQSKSFSSAWHLLRVFFGDFLRAKLGGGRMGAGACSSDRFHGFKYKVVPDTWWLHRGPWDPERWLKVLIFTLIFTPYSSAGMHHVDAV